MNRPGGPFGCTENRETRSLAFGQSRPAQAALGGAARGLGAVSSLPSRILSFSFSLPVPVPRLAGVQAGGQEDWEAVSGPGYVLLQLRCLEQLSGARPLRCGSLCWGSTIS